MKKLYAIELSGTDEVEIMSEERVVEYAKNRLTANEDERASWSFDTFSMNFEQAFQVIESFNEKVKRFIIARSSNCLQRCESADEVLSESHKRFAVDYCFKENGDIVETGMDYEYFDTEDEAEKFAENTIVASMKDSKFLLNEGLEEDFTLDELLEALDDEKEIESDMSDIAFLEDRLLVFTKREEDESNSLTMKRL